MKFLYNWTFSKITCASKECEYDDKRRVEVWKCKTSRYALHELVCTIFPVCISKKHIHFFITVFSCHSFIYLLKLSCLLYLGLEEESERTMKKKKDSGIKIKNKDTVKVRSGKWCWRWQGVGVCLEGGGCAADRRRRILTCIQWENTRYWKEENWLNKRNNK